MTVSIPHPKLLLLLLGVLVAAVIVYLLAAGNWPDDPASESVPVPERETPATAADEQAAALAALERDPTFAELTRNTTWRVTQFLPSTAGGDRAGVAVVIDFDSPVDSEGPWRVWTCQATRLHSYTFPYLGLTTIGVSFSEGGMEVETIQPLVTSPETTFGDDPQDPKYDLPECPEGLEDEEN